MKLAHSLLQHSFFRVHKTFSSLPSVMLGLIVGVKELLKSVPMLMVSFVWDAATSFTAVDKRSPASPRGRKSVGIATSCLTPITKVP